jgi:hypothetical protein
VATEERRVVLPYFSYEWPRKNAERGRANSIKVRTRRWRTCSVQGCEARYWGEEGGMCRPHYVQLWEPNKK